MSKQYLLTERQKGEVDSLEYQQKVLTELNKVCSIYSLYLSKKGNEFKEKKKKDVEGYFERVFSHFTEEELQQYLNFQEKFYAAILEEGKTLKKEKEN